MKQVLVLVTCLSLASYGATAWADEIECKRAEPSASARQSFPEVARQAQESARLFCTSWLSEPTEEQRTATLRASLVELGYSTRSAFRVKGWSFSEQLDDLDAAFSAFGTDEQKLPELTSGSDPFGNAFARFNGVPAPSVKLSDMCGGGCRSEVSELAEVFNGYRSPYNDLYDASNKALLQSLNRDWDRFLEVSKSQTFLEVLLTTQFQQDHFKADHLVGPPPMQVIAVHPQVVYEASSSIDDEFGLAIEWIGVNFWNRKVPLGVSFATVHTRVNGERETRKGFMLHIHNRYSIGWAKGDDDSGVFVTIDLLKMVTDGKAQLNSYMGNLKAR